MLQTPPSPTPTPDIPPVWPSGKIVCYDGDCGMCRGVIGWLDRLRLVPLDRSRPFQSFDGVMADRLWAANIHNELAVWDPLSGKIESGLEGLLGAVRDSWIEPVLPAARSRPVRWVLNHVYRLIAYNRRILSPLAPGPIRCACDPDYHAGYRWSFVGLAALLAVGLTALVAGTPAAGAIALALLLVANLATVLDGEARTNWFAHLFVVADLALLCYLPFAGFAAITDPGTGVFMRLVGLALAVVLADRSMERRIDAQGLDKAWLDLWRVLVPAGLVAGFLLASAF